MSSAKEMLNKVVIPVAGLGTRMLPFTKEQPKEMLPIYSNGKSGQLAVTPMVQIIFEQLYDYGFREFCFIIGRGKRVIEDHFTINYSLNSLNDASKNGDISPFYRKVEDCKIAWINQSRPQGFGHAVRLSEPFCDKNDFLVHAGDVTIVSSYKHSVLQRLRNFHYENDMDVTLCVKRITNWASLRQHGVIVPNMKDKKGFIVRRVIEKPKDPPSSFAIMPIYIFKPVIFRALKKTAKDTKGELQLTDAIQIVIEGGGKVGAVLLEKADVRLDIGTPESYMQALTYSYKFCHKPVRTSINKNRNSVVVRNA